MNKPIRFTGRNIPIEMAAKIMGKDQKFLRQAMIAREISIGVAFKKEGVSQYDFYNYTNEGTS